MDNRAVYSTLYTNTHRHNHHQYSAVSPGLAVSVLGLFAASRPPPPTHTHTSLSFSNPLVARCKPHFNKFSLQGYRVFIHVPGQWEMGDKMPIRSILNCIENVIGSFDSICMPVSYTGEFKLCVVLFAKGLEYNARVGQFVLAVLQELANTTSTCLCYLTTQVDFRLNLDLIQISRTLVSREWRDVLSFSLPPSRLNVDKPW